MKADRQMRQVRQMHTRLMGVPKQWRPTANTTPMKFNLYPRTSIVFAIVGRKDYRFRNLSNTGITQANRTPANASTCCGRESLFVALGELTALGIPFISFASASAS